MKPTDANASHLDMQAAARMWDEYATAHPEAVHLCPEYSVERFGDSAELADALLHEVIHGSKCATSTLAREFVDDGASLPRVGSHWIACDGAGAPRVILRSIELRLGTFNDADANFARDEGEDDLSLESWSREHRKYWQRTEAAHGRRWSEDEPIVFERFRIAWPPAHAGNEPEARATDSL